MAGWVGAAAAVCIYPDGSRYEGGFKDDKRDGHGCLYFPDGSRLVGHFKDDEANGEGVLYFKNGDKYEGSFKVSRSSSSNNRHKEERGWWVTCWSAAWHGMSEGRREGERGCVGGWVRTSGEERRESLAAAYCLPA